MDRPLIVVDPQPRGLTEIFEPAVFAHLQSLGRLEIHEGAGRMPAERLDALLPEAALLIGQSDMPRERLDRAAKLRAHHQRRDQLPAERRLRDLLRSAASMCSRRAAPSPSRSPK